MATDKVTNSRESKKARGATIEMARAPRHAAPVVETPKGEPTLADLVAENAMQIKELTATVGAHCTRLDRHRKELDDHERELDDHKRRIAALEGRLPRTSIKAEKEAEEEAATKAESEAEKAEAPKPKTEKASAEPSKVVFPDAPKGAVRWGEEWLYVTTDTEEPYSDSDPSILVAKAKGVVQGLVFYWYDRNGNPIDLLTPAQVRKYVPRNRMTKAARIN